MSLAKGASDATMHRRPGRLFPNARTAFRAFLEDARLATDEQVLLPSYFGWSPTDGSGVFDPVSSLGLAHAFYRLDDRLRIDLDHLESQLRRGRVRVVLLIHYFGEVDQACQDAVALAHSHGALVLEDEAHAMLSDLVGGACGRLGEACIFSLHKILPVPSGGMLVWNDPSRESDNVAGALAEYDLVEISRRRRENANTLDALLLPLRGLADPLWEERRDEIVPQSYPVIIRRGSRDLLYHAMNNAGFGVISLYHTLVDRIAPTDFPEAHWLSRRILNLPVHQDASGEQLAALVDHLGRCLRETVGGEP